MNCSSVFLFFFPLLLLLTRTSHRQQSKWNSQAVQSEKRVRRAKIQQRAKEPNLTFRCDPFVLAAVELSKLASGLATESERQCVWARGADRTVRPRRQAASTSPEPRR